MRPQPNRPLARARGDRSAHPVELSVVIPVYGCEDCLLELYEQLTQSLPKTTDSYEIVLVDDRSPDHSWPILEQLSERDPHVIAIRLSRNFGQHAAITAGLANSHGRWTVVMDCDLQDPPDQIQRLYERALEGYEVVLARRKSRTDSWLRRWFAGAYFRLLTVFLGIQTDGEFGTFSIMSHHAREAFLAIRDKNRHYLFIINWLGFDRTAIDIEHRRRFSGRSSYSLKRLLQHALDGVFFQTTTLLTAIVFIGFAIALAGVLLALYLVFLYLTATPPPGYTSLAVLMLVLGGVTITSIGVTGLYVGQVFQQVKDRPLYVIDRAVHRVGSRVEVAEPAGDVEIIV